MIFKDFEQTHIVPRKSLNKMHIFMVVGIFSKKFKIPLKTLLKTQKNLPKDVFFKKKDFLQFLMRNSKNLADHLEAVLVI